MPLDPEFAALIESARPSSPITARLLPAIGEDMAATGLALPRPAGVEASDFSAEWKGPGVSRANLIGRLARGYFRVADPVA